MVYEPKRLEGILRLGVIKLRVASGAFDAIAYLRPLGGRGAGFQ